VRNYHGQLSFAPSAAQLFSSPNRPRIHRRFATPRSSLLRWFQNDKNRARVFLLLVVILSGGLLLTYFQNASLQSRLTALQDEANGYHAQLQDSQTQNSQLQSLIAQLQSQNSVLSNQVQSLNLQNAHPTLAIWNSCGGPCAMSQTSWRAGGVPDTFTYYARYTADPPVGVYFLTLNQYVQFASCPLTGGAENQLTCVSGIYTYFSPTTSLNGVFHLAEGCASYVAVYYSDSSGVMYPTVSVQYNPATSLTGACA
jgi:cell division protein FtsB